MSFCKWIFSLLLLFTRCLQSGTLHTHVSEKKIQHQVICWTRRTWLWGSSARGTAGGLKQGRYLFARLHMLTLSRSLSLLSIIWPLSSYLSIPTSQELLMVIVFCKTHLLLVKIHYSPLLKHNATHIYIFNI